MPAQTPPTLRPFEPAKIPDSLKALKRWAPWEAVWSEKRQKFDKIPNHPNGYRLSTAKPEKWYAWDVALAAASGNPERFAGLGFVMTGAQDLTGVDLDNCVHGNTIAPWALEIVKSLDSYTELSPSGRGLRIWCTGASPADWVNHDQGIEVYSGHEPRFLTVTGHRLHMSGEQVKPLDPAVLAGIATKYARERSTAQVIDLNMPELLDDLVLPDVAELDLPYQVKDWLTEGKVMGDRSRVLAHTAVALYSLGLTDAQVFSLMATNPYCMDVALDHRHQDEDRALAYIWREHCCKGKPKASSKVATVADFDDISTSSPVGSGDSAIKNVAIRKRFQFDRANEFTQGKPVSWLVKGVLPLAEVGAIYGASGAGKSFLALDLVMAITQGLEWRGHKTAKGTVAYVCAEGASGFRLRIKAHCDHHGTDMAGLDLFVLADAPNLLEKADVKDLALALKDIPGLQLVVLDTLAQVTPGANENSGEDMGRALGHCKTLHKATGAMVLLVAHSGKDEGRGMRGWSGIKGALDVEINVERSGEYRSATITKMKDGSGEGDEYPFTLDTITMGEDEDGEPITSCVLKTGSAVSKAQRKAEPKGVWQQLVMRKAIDLTDQPGDTMVQALIDVVVNEMPKDENKKQDNRRRDAMRAIESLVAANRLSMADGLLRVL